LRQKIPITDYILQQFINIKYIRSIILLIFIRIHWYC